MDILTTMNMFHSSAVLGIGYPDTLAEGYTTWVPTQSSYLLGIGTRIFGEYLGIFGYFCLAIDPIQICMKTNYFIAFSLILYTSLLYRIIDTNITRGYYVFPYVTIICYLKIKA
jgi:hypothetical protein